MGLIIGVGIIVGAPVGDIVGEAVGDIVGVPVGDIVGVAVTGPLFFELVTANIAGISSITAAPDITTVLNIDPPLRRLRRVLSEEQFIGGGALMLYAKRQSSAGLVATYSSTKYCDNHI